MSLRRAAKATGRARLTSSSRSTTSTSCSSRASALSISAPRRAAGARSRRRASAPREGRGRVIAIDLLEMDPIEGVEFRQMDFHDPEAPRLLREWLGGLADGVLSDMAANATGHRKTDQLRIIGLVELAADFASEVLAPGGFFLAKVLQGGAEGELLARLKREFATVRHREAQGQPRRQRRALSAGDGVQRPHAVDAIADCVSRAHRERLQEPPRVVAWRRGSGAGTRAEPIARSRQQGAPQNPTISCQSSWRPVLFFRNGATAPDSRFSGAAVTGLRCSPAGNDSANGVASHWNRSKWTRKWPAVGLRSLRRRIDQANS